jgi:hypothetical protein
MSNAKTGITHPRKARNTQLVKDPGTGTAIPPKSLLRSDGRLVLDVVAISSDITNDSQATLGVKFWIWKSGK